MSEELNKEWEREFDERFVQKEFAGVKVACICGKCDTGAIWSHPKDIKSFISSLLAKQQEEFVKMIPGERKQHDPDCYFLEDGSYLESHCKCGYFTHNKVIADIKSKLKIKK